MCYLVVQQISLLSVAQLKEEYEIWGNVVTKELTLGEDITTINKVNQHNKKLS